MNHQIKIMRKDYKNYYKSSLKPSTHNIDDVFYMIPKNINISNQKAQEITKKYNIEFDKWGERFRNSNLINL